MSRDSKLIAVLHLLLVLVETCLSQGCDPSGINCISCTEYRTCIAGSPQGKLVSCKNGGSCADDNLKQCQIKLNCYASNECEQNGIFPDAMNDSKYFVCLSDGSAGFLKYEFSCPDGQFFDQSVSCVPRDLTSTSPASSTTAPNTPIPTTTSNNPTPATTPNTPIPTTTSNNPTPATTPNTPIPTTTSNNPTPATTPNTPIPTTTTSPSSPTPVPPFVCPGPGIFPNVDNCKVYYRCSTSGKLFYYICPGRSYFNENILKCSLIISPACQEQILKNSTSTSPLVTTTTATTPKPTATTSATTTTVPTTTTTAVTTTATTSTTPTTTATSTTPTTIATSTTPTSQSPTTTALFSCPAAGTFENPADCKTYYRCSTSGKVFRYTCPGTSYFNEITKRCNLVVTARCRKLIQG